ncbi:MULTISPECIES: outer membrane beta-barrel protein [Dysgonomonas]|uniref:Outer membrane protein beta-barrel domain-containing protein n=1 Tax=Dysgonomonas gadei ATCC BAA-286 TaxID=742766 RepID=F5IUK3_9BACT|nr:MULTISPECIES: outer membrane beta-barrel protein [Dysgonomonas]EGK03137.1 hypothetical protein HMPREF9455_00770 [Dysgonomonas gadei ATCC BAA-286]MBF0650991.1 outer membrane beta-barrel protein [Dysgonomonas sp. GY75]
MKKLIIAIILTCCFSASLSAQQRSRHETTLGYGMGTTSELLDALTDIIVWGITAGTTSSDDTYSGAFHIGYKYSITERFSLGGTFLYENGKSDAYFKGDRTGEFNRNYYTFAAEGKVKYLNKKNLALYGLFGTGATIYEQKFTGNDNTTDKNSNLHINFQLTPIGIQFGKNIGGFAELGCGYKGIISAGIFTRF